VFNFFATYHIVKRRYGKPQIVSIWVPIICGIALMVALFFGVDEIRERLTAPDQGSTFARIPQFITALNIIRHLPFTGTGLNSYTAYIFQYADVDGRYADALRFRVHNGLLLWTAETGLLGGFAYFMLYWTALKKAWKTWEIEDDFLALVGTATFIGLISWWVKSMYNIHSPLGDFSLWLHLSFAWIVWNCAARTRAGSSP